MIHESFSNLAFRDVNRQDNRERLKVNRDHDVQRPIGKVTALEPLDPKGLIAQLRIAKTTLGDERASGSHARVCSTVQSDSE